MISKILVATDGSETAWKSIEYAVALAKQTGATITLLSVIDKGFFVTRSIPSVATPTHLIEPIEDYLRQVAEAHIEEAEKLCKKKGVQSKKVIRSGHPVEEIIKEAEESKVDLIVMGSHGRSAIKAAFLGSVTFGTIHKDTKIPLLIVRK
ncbi:MAG: universal stress protein [Thermodesulfovibrionales bacterium]|nr:universal stress protein [Thermodesulfovibrionales bacterium]